METNYCEKELYMQDTLVFEITRRCTQQCKHCMRGPMQLIDIDNKIIDTFFYKLYKYDYVHINNIVFTGGEPLLNIKAIKYILEILKDCSWFISFDSFGIVTNGMVYSDEIEKTLYELYSHALKPEDCYLICSTDQFHIKPSKAIINKMRQLPFFEESQRKIISRADILNIGLAEKNNLGCPKQGNKFKKIRYFTNENEHDTGDQVRKFYIFDDVCINCKGFILSNVDYSYDFEDEFNLGNILNKDLLQVSQKAKIKTLKLKK